MDVSRLPLRLAVALGLLAAASPALAQTTVSGTVFDPLEAKPVKLGSVSLVRASTVAALPPGATVYPEITAELDFFGNWSAIVDETDLLTAIETCLRAS